MNRNALKPFFYKFNEDDIEMNKLKEFADKRPYLYSRIDKLIEIIDTTATPKILEIIYSIVEDVECVRDEKAFNDGFKKCQNDSANFVVDTSTGYHDSCYYKPTCSKKEAKKLLESGLCCAVCRYYSHEECINPIYTEFSRPDVKPYQICECVKFDGKKYSNYYFDGKQYCKRGNRTLERKEHFSEVAEETVNRLKSNLKEKDDFIYFFREELPEVYRKMMEEFKKRKDISK